MNRMTLPTASQPSIFNSESDQAFLRANSDNYEWLVSRIQGMDPRDNSEAVLCSVVASARLAATFHAGRFADGAIENPAFEIGARLPKLSAQEPDIPAILRSSKRRVLHVASCVNGIGGHTRMLHHWIDNDHSSCHSLALTSQETEPIPHWLCETVKKNGGHLTALSLASGLCERAMLLRELARRTADLVILHHSPFDVVPTVAFATRDCPPVAIVNHADHVFWLGSSVADTVINMRTVACKHTRDRRFVCNNVVIPIPLADPARKYSTQAARQKLGIPEDAVVLLSIARAEKYRPCGPYDFFRTAATILNRHSAAHLYVIGESVAGIAPYLRGPIHERLHVLGAIEDPSLYRAAADIYLETFPFGTQTAMLEAALSGLPVVTSYAPLFPLLVANDDAVQDVIPNPANEQEYVDRADRLARQPELRVNLGNTLRTRLSVDHIQQGWLTRLASIYQQTDRLMHSPHPIPISPCATSQEDIALSLWHVMSDGRNYFRGTSVDVGTILCHASSVAKYAGNYAKARHLAMRAVRLDPFHGARWHLLARALLGSAKHANSAVSH